MFYGMLTMLENCNFRGARVSRVLTPQFPFEATIKNNSKMLQYGIKLEKTILKGQKLLLGRILEKEEFYER